MGKIQELYNTLKSAGADVGTEKEFSDWFQAPGQDGYNNRKHLYDTFKSAGADIGDSYEEFASWLNLQPKATQTVDNASKAAPTAKPMQTPQATQQPSTDVPTATPKSRLEVSTEDDRPSQSYEKTTDPVLRSTTEVNPEAVKEWEGYKEANPLQAQYIEKSIGADRKLPTFEQYVKADAEAQRKDPIGYAFSKSMNEMSNADRAHAYLADQKAEIEKQLNDIAKKRMQDYADSNGAALGMTVQEYLNLDEDYKNLSTALEQAKKSEQVSDNARDARTGDSGFWRGVADGLTDANAWTLGALDIQGLMPMMRLKRKLENGEQLTDSEQALAQQMANNTAISDEYADKQGSWYNIGNIASQSLPFMLQFAMTGGGFGTLTRVGTKLGADAARKFTQNALLRNIIKYTGTAVGDIAGAAVMANTVGAANTVNDIFDRYRGTLIQTGDGQYQFAGGKGLGQSIYEGATAQTIEFYTEKLGAHLAITKQASKALGKMGLSKLSTAMSKLGGNKTLSVLGMQDYPSEVLEEEANIILNASFVGDNQFKDLWDSKQQTDLALGMLFSVGGMQAGTTAVNGAYSGAQYQRMKHAMNKWQVRGSGVFNDNAEWARIQNSLDNADNQHIADAVNSILDNGKYTESQKRAIAGYASALVKMRGYNSALMSVVTDPKEPKRDNKLAEEMIGYNANPQQRRELYLEAYGRRKALSQFMDEEQINEIVADPESYLASGKADAFTAEQKAQIEGFAHNQIALNSTRQRIADDTDLEVANFEATVDRMSNDGNIVFGTIRNTGEDSKKKPRKEVVVIKGKVVANDDGSVNVEQSDESLVALVDGKEQMIAPKDLADVQITSAEEQKNLEREMVSNEYVLSQESGMNGMPINKVGNTFKYLDPDGVEHTATIVPTADGQQLPDGQLFVSIDGAEPVAMSQTPLQVGINDYDYAQLQEAKRNKGKQKPTADTTPTDQVETPTEDIEATTDNAVQPQPQYKQGDRVTVNYSGQRYEGTITGEYNDGEKLLVEFEGPDGTRTYPFNMEDVSPIEAVAIPEQTDTATDTQIAAVEPTEEPTSEPTAPVADETAPTKAIDRIPKDESGQPLYEQSDVATAAEAVLDETEGDTDMASTVVNSMIDDKKKALDKANKAKSKGGNTISEKIASEKERKAAIDKAQSELDFWKGVADELAKHNGTAAENAAPQADTVEETPTADEAAPDVAPTAEGTGVATTTTTTTTPTADTETATGTATDKTTTTADEADKAATDSQEPSSKQTNSDKDAVNQAAGGVGSKGIMSEGEKPETDIKTLRKKWAYMRGKMPGNSVFVIEDTDGRLYSFDDDATRINAALNGKGEKANTDFIEITEQQFKDAAYVLGLKNFRIGLYNINDINIDDSADTEAKSALDTVKDIIRAVAERRAVDTGNFGELLRGLADDELNSALRYADNTKGRSKADKENIGALRRAIATELDERDNAADTKVAEQKGYDSTIEFFKNAPNDFDYDKYINDHEQLAATAEANGWPGEAAVQRGVVRAATELKKKSEAAKKDLEAQPKEEQTEAKPFHDANRSEEFNELVNLIIETDKLADTPNTTDAIDAQIERNSEKVERIMRGLNDEEFSALDELFYGDNPLFGKDSIYDMTYDRIDEERKLAKAKAEKQAKERAIYDSEQSRLKHTYDQKEIDALSKAYVDAQNESRNAWRALTDNKDEGRKDELNSAYDNAVSKKSAAEKALKSKLSEYDDKTLVEIGKRDGDISKITSDIIRGRAASRELAHEYVNMLDNQGEISGKGKPKYRLIDFVDKKSARIPVRGIYHDNGYAIATNLYTLVADKRAYSEADNGKIIDSNGEEIAMEFPAWRKIMPKAIRTTGIDAKELLDFLAGVKEKAKVAKEKYGGCIVMMNIGGTIWATKAERLEKFAQAALGLGGKIYLQDIVELASSPMHTESANGFAMVMPVHMSASDLRNNPKNVFVYKPTTLGVSEQSKVYKETHPNEVADDTSTEAPNENGNTVADTQSAETEAKKDTAKVEAQPEQKDNAVEKIEDVGEKIGGAKKDIAAEAKQRMADDLDKSDSQLASEIESKTLSKIFNFDLPKLRAGGMSNEVISFIKICKQMIPAKPRVGYKVRQWVRDTMEVYKLCLNAGTKWEQLSEMLKGKYADTKLAKIYNSYMAVGGFDSGLELNGAYIRQLGADAKMYDDGKEVSLAGKWYVSGAAKHSGTYDTKEEAIEALKAYAGDNAVPKSSGKKQIEFVVYRNNTTGKFFITPKGKGDIILQDGFETSKEAFAYIKEHNAEMAERYQTLLSETKVDFNENRERKGRDYRGGKDISAQEFMDTFGFRGVEFGNWTNQKDRAKSINECYDALMDLADVLGVDPKALSLNGTLGMAFGARGGGKFSAHYEPDKVVINLTKTKGAGSLAHEWFHAVDNYFAKMGGAKLGFATSKGGLFPESITMIPRDKEDYVYYDSKTRRTITEEEYKQRFANHGVRKEIADAWVALMKAINASDYKKRSGAYAYLHSSNYWTEPTELGARAFSKWVENELSKRNATNDYLANNPAIFTESASESTRKYMPYPFDTDAQWMEEAFGNLFSTMEQKTDSESGKVMLYHKADGTVTELTSEEVALRNSIMDLLRNAGIEVITDSKEAQRVLDDEISRDGVRMQKVYHGSGTDFDAFDFSHMGEGEGAQAYGWGGYVTEIEGIGRTYARSSSSTKTLNRSRLRHEISFLEESLPFWSGEAKLEGEERLKQLEEELYRLESEPEPVLYTVEIPDDNGENYITWSKGLPKSQRKKIADHLRTLPDSLLDAQRQVHGSNWLPNGWNTLANVIENNPTWGKDIVERLKDAFGSSKEASMTLSDIGFVGISYPAQYRIGGRNDGAKNYVIFNESDMKITDKARFFRTKDGVAYGFTIGGKIYIDTSIAKADTPIHEYTHLWASALRESNPKEWANVVSLMKGTPVWDEVRQNYPELTTDDEIADEVLAHYSGQRGAEQLREAQRKAAEESGSVMASANAVSAIERVRKALSKFWKGVADLLNIHFTTAEEVADRVLYDLLRGYKPQSKADGNARLQKAESEEGDLLFRQRYIEAEMAQIEADAKANGTYMKAPNGKRSKLTPRQWAQVRTKAFKEWFGDWELGAKVLNIVSAAKDHGFNNFDDARKWAKGNIVRTLSNEETGGKGEIRISNNAVNKFLSESAVEKSDSKDVHMSVLKVLPNVIRESIDAEQHPDYKKGEDGKRNAENGINENVTMHRLYGAVNIDGKTYRVKITLKEYIDTNRPQKAYSYEATKIELLAGTLVGGIPSNPSTNNSITVSKLLNGVEKSYGNGEKILDSSKVVDENGEPMVVYHGTKRKFWAFDGGKSKGVFTDGLNFFSLDRDFSERWINRDDERQRDPEDNAKLEEARQKSLQHKRETVKPLIDKYGSPRYAEVPEYNELAKEWDEWERNNLGLGGMTLEEAKYDYGKRLLECYINARNIYNPKDKYESEGRQMLIDLGIINATESGREKYMTDMYASNGSYLYYERKEVVDELKRRGYDGILLSEDVYSDESKNLRTLAVWDPTQIKSATENEGTFDSTNPDIRKREGNGVATDNEVVMAVDPVSKVLGSPRGTAQQRKARAERERRRMAETVEQMVEKLQLDNVDVITDTSTLSGRKAKAKGWYDPKTGRIVVVLPNHSSAMDVAQTVLHEAVAHYGLRRLFGDHFDSFLDTVWLSAEGDVKQRILDLAQRNGWDFRTATEEYLASLAEDTEFDNMNASWWNKIKTLFSEMLDKLGLGELLPMKLSDNELRYILWRSYMNLQGNDIGIMGNAADISKQMQLGVGNFTNTANNDKAADAEPLFRDGTPVAEGATAVRKALVRDKYEQRIKSGWYQTAEAIYDSMQSVKNAMEMVYEAEGEKKPYIEDIPMYENAYIGENVLSSMNKAQADYFANTLFKAMVEEYSKLARTKEERRDLDEYMMAKHGLERNEKMAERDAQKAYDEYKAANPSGTKTLNDFLTAYRQKEYAGLVGLFAKDEQIASALDRMEYLRERLKNVTDPSERAGIRKQIAELRLSNHNRAEKLATDVVELYESENETADLWDAVRGVTGYTLEKQLSTGLMAADTYNKIKAMYEYYIPLRGFEADVSEDVYAYLGDNGANRNEAFVPVAEGRESKADNPLAYMQSMAESAIQSGNRNEMVKQRFLTFVQNHPSDLYSVSEMWLAYNEDTEEWEPVVNEEIDANDSPATVAAKQQAFEEHMSLLAEAEPDKYRKASQAKNIPYRVLKKTQLKEHQVMVKRNGITYIITVNGNPRLAQAINGMTNPDADISGAIGKIVEVTQGLNRTLSQLYTSRNPNFVVSNFIRDSIYSSTMLLVKESPEYLANFIANVSKYNPLKMSSMFRKWNRGEVDDADMLLFKRFMLNGGETGYTKLKAIEERKNDIAKQIKNATGKSRAKLIWEWIATSLDVVGRAVENTNRFGAFVTSLDMGRDVTRAAYDAKEISVNFNRKGSGSKMMGANGQTKFGNTAAFVSGVGRSLYIFWNAAIQGTGNLFKNYRRHPLKATAMTTFWLGLGYLMSAVMMGADGDGDDDDESKYNGYFNLSQFIRRDNLCISVGGGQYASLPLPIEFRAVYGIGELIGSVTSGKEQLTGDEIAYALFEQVSQIAPIDYSAGGMNAFIPSIVRPIREIEKNVSWTGLPIAKETPFNKNMPEYTKHYKNTNSILVGLTEQLNHAFGGDKYTRASTEWAEVNPAKVEYLMNSYLSGYFQIIDQTIKTAETIVGARDFEAKNIPLLNRVLKSGDERTAYRKINNDFYKAKEKYKILKGRLSGYKREALLGDEEYRQKWVNLMSEKEFEEMKVFDVFNKQLNKLYEVRKQMPEGSDEAKEIDTMSQALRIDALQAISDISNE